MQIAPLPTDEQERLRTLNQYSILDTEAESVFDAMVNMASYICQTPIAAISLVDENRLWFKAITGLDAKEIPREIAFSAHTILQNEIMVVPDATLDERFFDNPLVTSEPDVRFYVGVPLVAPNGQHLGALCVIDRVARELNQEQLKAINVLAKNIMAHLDLRLSHKQTRQYVDDLQLTSSVFDSSNESIVITDANNSIVKVNPSFISTTGYTLSEVQERNLNSLSSGRQSEVLYREMWEILNTSGQWNGEVWNKLKNGGEYVEHLSIIRLFNPDGSKRLHIATFSDIAKKKQADKLIWYQANLDHLTQVPNRRLFLDRMEQEMKTTNRTGLPTALFFIDLDYFKEVNDKFGHDIGDKVLIQAVRRIQRSVRETDTIARMGGDEFTVILSQIDNLTDTKIVAKKIVAALGQSFIVDGYELNISASIGVAVYPNNGGSAEQLLKYADFAMYVAKRRSKFSCHNADEDFLESPLLMNY